MLLGSMLAASGLPGAAALARVGRRIGFFTVRDLLFHLPRKYEDLREMSTLAQLAGRDDEGSVVSARVRVTDLRLEQTWRRKVQRTTAFLTDDTGEAEATWFGRRFIEKRLKRGDWIVVSGRLKKRGWVLVFDNPEFQREDAAGEVLHAGRIVPVYRLTEGLTAARLRPAIRAALDRAGVHYPEYLPARVLDQERLVPIGKALDEAHYPSSFEGQEAALRRLAFDELFALQIGMVGRRRQRGRAQARKIEVGRGTDRRLVRSIEGALRRALDRAVELTPDQAAAMSAIRGDIGRAEPMLRLLQGDVGSGKTAVAAYALGGAALAGRQAALLAPTDLLARQHLATVGGLLEEAGIEPTLLVGSQTAAGRRQAHEGIAAGNARVVVGTHALLQEQVRFADLALVVIDEQHRFGVEQRGALEAKAGRPPHVLLMTATPIPRTLGQVLYADLDVSDLRTPPTGRLAVATGIRRPDQLGGTWDRVHAEARAGHGTFVVVPAIEESDELGVVAAEAEVERLRALLPELRVEVIHGRIKPAERDKRMAAFRDGGVHVLVGTTVIEVGVDVPHATIMIIEGADRFGLAQLHQLRGRVGRSTAESFCVLSSDTTDQTAIARLRAVVELRDGFALAEADFELRGEGDVLGLAQSGLPRLRVASLQRREHRDLAARARHQAERLLDSKGMLAAAHRPLAQELANGWLAPIAAGEPASGA